MFTGVFKNYILPVATLSGSIIGVGFLSLPYIASKIGMPAMLLYFIALTIFVVCIHLIFAHIALRTPDHKRMPGFIGFYLGAWPRRIATVSMVGGSFGVLLAYIVVGGQFLHALLSPVLGGNQSWYAAAYFSVGALLIFYGVSIISKVDFTALVLLVCVFGLVLWKGLPYINVQNLLISNFDIRISNFLLPYGALLFSLWGTGLIPEVEEMLAGNKKLLTTVVVAGTIIPAVIYLCFTLLILGISGTQTTESALLGLKDFVGPGIVSIALLIGIITTFTCFISQGLLLKKIFMYDLGLSHRPAWALVCFVPLALLLFGFTSFIPLVSFIGGVFLSIEGILILLMYQKIGGKELVVYPLMLFFAGIAFYSITSFWN